jgi:hypothetical protein
MCSQTISICTFLFSQNWAYQLHIQTKLHSVLKHKPKSYQAETHHTDINRAVCINIVA